jgi:uncharacterized protein YndB with AHSA1/START domain
LKIDRSVVIGRAQDEVWDVLRDPSLMPQWFAKLGNFVALEGDGTAAGDRYTIDYLREDDDKELRVEVLSVDEGDGHIHRFEGLPVAFTIASVLDAQERELTTWTATIEVRLSLVQRALGPVIRGYLDDLAGDMADGFKNYLEAR